MYIDQKLKIASERIDQTNTRVDDFKLELEKYDKQFTLFREDQSNLREDIINHKELITQKLNEINDNFLQETTKLRLLCSENSEYSK
jgi:predicted  nucleic acid-binding Zn-ribbon protein